MKKVKVIIPLCKICDCELENVDGITLREYCDECQEKIQESKSINPHSFGGIKAIWEDIDKRI